MSKQTNDDDIMFEEVQILTLTDEDGVETDYEFLERIPYKEKEYCVLYPVNGTREDEYIVLEIIEESGSDEAIYRGLDDQKVMEKVFAIFQNS